MIYCAKPLDQYTVYKHEIDAAIEQVLTSGVYIKGVNVTAFEKEFAEFVGTKYAIGVGNGTDALRVALGALGVGKGDEVITVSHTAVATVTAIEQVQATPVLVDIEPDTFVMDTTHLEKALSKKTKAVIAVHLYGQAVNLSEVKKFCQRHNLFLVEDCAQAHGAKYAGSSVGSIGDISAFSFYPTKNLGAIGDGGAVLTSDADLAHRCRLLREYGWEERYISKISGWNTRLDELQAAILRVKLRYLQSDNAIRQSLAENYVRGLTDLPITLPVTRRDNEHVYHLFVIRTERRDDLLNFLQAQGIHSAIHYPVPIHLQPAYLQKIKCAGKLTVTEKAASEILSLPLYPQLTSDDQEKVIQCVRKFFS